MDSILESLLKKPTEVTYYLMAQDRLVCTISNRGKVEIERYDLVPLDLYLEEDNTDISVWYNNWTNFEDWCSNRLLSLSRVHAKEILNSVGLQRAKSISDRCEVALDCKCMLLKDFYWVTESRESDWVNLNLFDNSLGDIADISLKGKALTAHNREVAIRDLSTEGLAPKAWVRESDGFYLLKGGTLSAVKNEVLASKSLNELGFQVLSYSADTYDNIPVSKSKCFTSKTVGFVSAGELNMNHDVKPLIENEYKKDFLIMNLCDFLVGNSDRHQDNWGFMFNENREIVGFAPIFDFNKSFIASELFWCFPYQMFGIYKPAFDVAREAIEYLQLDINELLTKCSNSFVEKRLELLLRK